MLAPCPGGVGPLVHSWQDCENGKTFLKGNLLKMCEEPPKLHTVWLRNSIYRKLIPRKRSKRRKDGCRKMCTVALFIEGKGTENKESYQNLPPPGNG